jgi:DNA-binding NarL/FixJ family response regulator
MTRVVLIDDHGLFRAGVRTELGEQVEVVGDAGTVEEAVELIVREAPDVVLLDVHMPGGGGVEVIRRVAGLTRPASASWPSASQTPPTTSSASSVRAPAAT